MEIFFRKPSINWLFEHYSHKSHTQEMKITADADFELNFATSVPEVKAQLIIYPMLKRNKTGCNKWLCQFSSPIL
jgi:hypothetical protein